MAPTDAGLGAATVLNPVVPVRMRRVLNVESGLNDGLATPVVLFAVAAAAGFADGSTEHGAREAVVEIVIGVLVGAAAGFLTGKLLGTAHDHGWSEDALVPVAVLVVPLMSYYGADASGGNGFIAAFVAGTMFARAMLDLSRMHRNLEVTDQVAALLGYAVWMLFGAVVVTHLAPLMRWHSLLFAVLSLTVLRMLPVALCLLGSGLRSRSVAFIGWFGPRGLASVVFALIAFESLGAASDRGVPGRRGTPKDPISAPLRPRPVGCRGSRARGPPAGRRGGRAPAHGREPPGRHWRQLFGGLRGGRRCPAGQG